MQRYFFDRVSEAGAEFDYSGCELANVDCAAEMAEIIAIDLAIDATANWHGWSVKVSNAIGQHIVTVPIHEVDL